MMIPVLAKSARSLRIPVSVVDSHVEDEVVVVDSARPPIIMPGPAYEAVVPNISVTTISIVGM